MNLPCDVVTVLMMTTCVISYCQHSYLQTITCIFYICPAPFNVLYKHAVLWLKCAVDLLFDPTEYNSLLNTVDVDYTNYYIY